MSLKCRKEENMKQNYRFIIMYDGSRYYGWQRQPDHDTVQGKLEAVLERLANPGGLPAAGGAGTIGGQNGLGGQPV